MGAMAVEVRVGARQEGRPDEAGARGAVESVAAGMAEVTARV